MHLIHGTIASTNVAQPILAAAVVPDRISPFQQFMAQNNGSNVMRIGDASISSTRGIILTPTTLGFGVMPQLQYSGDLSEFYILGTSGDVYDILILD